VVSSTLRDCTKVASFDIPESGPQDSVNNLALQAMLVSALGKFARQWVRYWKS